MPFRIVCAWCSPTRPVHSAQVANHRRRIVTVNLLAEYAYIMQEGGILYTVTDVPELGEWMSNAMEKVRLARTPITVRASK